MKELTIFQTIILVAAAVVIIIKTIHFIARFRGKKIYRWLYFDNDSIFRSKSAESVRQKKLQNTFSLVLLALFFLLAILFYLG